MLQVIEAITLLLKAILRFLQFNLFINPLGSLVEKCSGYAYCLIFNDRSDVTQTFLAKGLGWDLIS